MADDGNVAKTLRVELEGRAMETQYLDTMYAIRLIEAFADAVAKVKSAAPPSSGPAEERKP